MSKEKSIKINQYKTKHSRAVSTVFVACKPPPRVGLYRFVHASLTSFGVTLCLVMSFLLQGVSVVFANEQAPVIDHEVAGETQTADQTAVVADTGTDEIEADEDLSVSELSSPANENPDSDSSANQDPSLAPSETTELIESDPSPISDSAEMDSETSLLNDSLVNDSTSTSPLVGGTTVSSTISSFGTSSTTATSTAQTSEESDTASSSLPSSGEGDNKSDVQSEAATTTETEQSQTTNSGSDMVETELSDTVSIEEDEAMGPALSEPISVSYSDSGYMFGNNECTKLASGSFYCHEARADILSDALFAAPDQDGDFEIFLVRNGTQVQITNNQVDDAAPFYDVNSETIVWHRMIDDRYQIIAYDLATGGEAQLTTGSVNNMEPTRQGKYIVWQRWVTNNWEIVLFDGKTETQLSQATAHDMAPYIHGTLVVWNRVDDGGERTIEMYDIDSGSYVTVNDPAGLSVTNPRMVLVYDQLHPNGDIITKGYDMLAKKFIQLDTLPRQLPEQIPESEPTSETRAMIQSKPSIKGDEVVNGEIETDDPPAPPLESTDQASSTLTLDLTTTTESGASSTVTARPVTEFDLIIEPYEPVSSSTEGVQASST